MNKVTLCENTLDPSTWTTHENVEDVREFLVEHFGVWPNTARIYLDHVANNADITPFDQAGIDRLGRVQGHFFVVVYPEGIELILIIVAVVIAAVAIGLVFLFRPTAPENKQEESSNNRLAGRQNEARPNERIPDIFGQLWATFDLIAVVYRSFVTNEEIEHAYMCIGRGSYAINPDDIRDDITPLNQIDGTSAGVYEPNTSPNGGSPSIQIGAVINERVYNVQQFNSVNGQVLRAPNLNTYLGNGDVRFETPNLIHNNAGYDFTKNFAIGDTVGVGGLETDDDLAVDSAAVQPSVHLNGSYSISGITASTISLTNPAAINANWSALAAFGGGVSTYRDINLVANGVFEVGPFVIPNTAISQIWVNVVAEQGIFIIDLKGRQLDWSANFQIGIQESDAAGTPFGGITWFTGTVKPNNFSGNGAFSSDPDRRTKGTTLRITLPAGFTVHGGFLVYAKRSSNTDLSKNQVVDQIQWRDLYIVSETGLTDFGNVTTIQTLTRPTISALAIRERKLNALVTRKVPALVGGVFTGLVASKNAADILCAMALDPFIGNRKLSELDVTGIYAVAGIGGFIQLYFAILANLQAPIEFCYAFDDSKVSFEESVAQLAAAICCIAYRRGSTLTLSFEQKTNNSVLLFNHRNKIPKSETRTFTFGTLNDNDGIEVTYIEPHAPNYPNIDTSVVLYFPTNKSAVNAKKVTLIGVRNVYQATILGWRLYQKLIFQNTITQFEATEEAALLVINDRILVADNTRSDTQDGEVLDQVVLQLTLSQKVTFDSRFNYTIYLQNPDGTVEAIPITAGGTDHQVVLAHAPTLPAVIDPTKYARTTYMIVNDAPVRQNAFLLSEKSPKDGKQFEVKAVNYDDQYYKHDQDYATNILIAGQFLEVMLTPPPPNVEVDGLFIEVMTQ